MSLTKEQKEKKILMLAKLDFYGWPASKYWNFRYLERMHNYLLEFLADRMQEVVAAEPNQKDFMWDFLVLSCGVSTQDVKKFCYPKEHQNQSMTAVEFLTGWINALNDRTPMDRLFQLYCTEFFQHSESVAWCEANLSDVGYRWHCNFCVDMFSHAKPTKD